MTFASGKTKDYIRLIHQFWLHVRTSMITYKHSIIQLNFYDI